jgi:type VI protein secretion system component VasF
MIIYHQKEEVTIECRIEGGRENNNIRDQLYMQIYREESTQPAKFSPIKAGI